MTADEIDPTGPLAAPPDRRRFGLIAGLLLLPLLGLGVLVARPELDGVWEHHPSHFWLVLAAGGINAVLAYGTGTAAHRRNDARVFLVSLSFLAAAGFLGLHALATPGVLLASSNAGFALASPVGLVVSSVFAAASSANHKAQTAQAIIRRAPLIRWSLIAVMAVWAFASLARFGGLDSPLAPERATGILAGFALVGVVLYLIAVVRYLRIPRHPASSLPLSLAAAFALLAEAMISVAVGRNWHASWWEWHVLMLIAFVIVAVAAQRSWREERWIGLYLPETASANREVSVIFADLAGFTAYSEGHASPTCDRDAQHLLHRGDPPSRRAFRRRDRTDRRRHDGHVQRPRGSARSRPEGGGAALAIQQTTEEIATTARSGHGFISGSTRGRSRSASSAPPEAEPSRSSATPSMLLPALRAKRKPVRSRSAARPCSLCPER